MRIKFWGVRGSVTCAYPDYLEFGGNTSCVEVQVGAHTVILDGGTGLLWLGNDLLKRGVKDIHLLMSHFHNDHTAGLNYFKPLYIPGHAIHIKAALNYGDHTIEDLFRRHMMEELHPVQYDHLGADIDCRGFEAGDGFDLADGVRVETYMLRHPAGCTSYRIEADGKVLVYATDTEHVPGEPDLGLVEHMKDADLVIYDTTYTEEELPSKRGWGHSSWNEGVKLCQMAGARRMAMFHYSPDHNDDQVRTLAAEATAAWPGVFAAKEGLVVDL